MLFMLLFIGELAKKASVDAMETRAPNDGVEMMLYSAS